MVPLPHDVDYHRLGIIQRFIKEPPTTATGTCVLITIHFNMTHLSVVLVYLQVNHVFCSLPDSPLVSLTGLHLSEMHAL